MRNRRLNVDDGRGMGEALNETDAAGLGITVPATYYAQLYNTKLRSPLQRIIQQRMDSPAMQFYTCESV